jgi:hypothetical protein
LHVFVSNPRLLFDLQFFLRRIGCATGQVHSHELEVQLPGAPSEGQARREVELYLALWQGRKNLSGLDVFVVGDGGTSSCG